MRYFFYSRETNLIESFAIELQNHLVIQENPNIYEYASLKNFFESMGWRFEFEKKLIDSQTNNSVKKNLWEAKDKNNTLIYNVVKKMDGRSLQFEIEEPYEIEDKMEYVKFLRTVFWEMWEKFKEEKLFYQEGFAFNMDNAFFSRAMIIPQNTLGEIMAKTAPHKNPEDHVNLLKMAEVYNVHFLLIDERLRDLGIRVS